MRTLDDRERVRLKLLNPIGVGTALASKYGDVVSKELDLLRDDLKMLDDIEAQLQLYVDRLRAAQRTGEVRPDIDPRIALELFVSPLAQRWLQYTGPITYEYTDTLVDYALHGLAPR